MLKIEKQGKDIIWYSIDEKPLIEVLKELNPTTKVSLYRAYANGEDDKVDIYNGLVKDVPKNYRRLQNIVCFAYKELKDDIICIATTDVTLEEIRRLK